MTDTAHGTSARSRTVRRAAVIGGGLVAVVVGGLVAVSTMLPSPEQVAQEYVDAVADGEVRTALEMTSRSGGDAALLSDEIYAAAEQRPTSYTLGETTDLRDSMRIEVEAEGGVGGQDEITLERRDRIFGLLDHWVVTEGLSSSLGVFAPAPSFSVNGLDVDATEQSADYAVFPGTYSVNPLGGSEWLDAEPSTVEVPLGELVGVSPSQPRPSSALEEELHAAVDEWLDECLQSTEAGPAGCPQSVRTPGDVRNVSWELTTPPTINYSMLTLSFPVSLGSTDGVATATYESRGDGAKWTRTTAESPLRFIITVDESGDGLSVHLEH